MSVISFRMVLEVPNRSWIFAISHNILFEHNILRNFGNFDIWGEKILAFLITNRQFWIIYLLNYNWKKSYIGEKWAQNLKVFSFFYFVPILCNIVVNTCLYEVFLVKSVILVLFNNSKLHFYADLWIEVKGRFVS